MATIPLSEFTTIAQALSNVTLVNPNRNVGYQPQAEGQQLPRFLFDYEGENSIELKSDITDHFTENNSAINDHISLQPEKVTVKGYIGEINDILPNPVPLLRFAQERLTPLQILEPELTLAAARAQSIALQTSQAVSNAQQNIQAWGSVDGARRLNRINGSQTPEELAADLNRARNQNNQQIAFQQFYGYWRSRTLFTIQTPWAVFENMAIESLRAIQDEESEETSTFEITFKIIRFAETNFFIQANDASNFNPNNFNGRSLNQSEPLVDLGTSVPEDSISLLSRIA